MGRVVGLVLTVIAGLLVLTGRPTPALAEARLALLIGNQAYNAKVGALRNPRNDVVLIGAALKSLGFKVVETGDADYRSMDTAIKRHIQLARRGGPGTISFVYYSGHGAADPDTKINYLIPVDVANADDDDLWTNSLNLNSVVEALRGQAPQATHYVVFDACRNELNLTRKGRKALADKGFVPMAYTPGVMVAYATAPGKTATDIGSLSGPYAKALAEEIVKPGVEALSMFRRVALRVNREIGQDPWMSASTLPEIYFAGETGAATRPLPATPQTSEDERIWHLVKDSTDPAVLESYLKQFRTGIFAELARSRLETLKKKQVALAEPPRPSPVRPSPPVAPQGATRDPTVDLKLSHWLPPSHPLQKTFEEWSASVERASNGTIKSRIFPSQQLGKATDHYDMTRDGLVELGYVNPGYQPGRFPVIAAGDLPFLFANAKGGSQALDAWYRKYAESEMKDVKFCFAIVHDPGAIHSRARKVVVPGDIRGMKIRPAHATMASLVTQLGGTNVQSSAPEVRELLDKGVIEAVTFPWGSVALFGIDKVTKYHMDVPLYTTTFAFVFNKGTYGRMSAAQRKVIDDHCTSEWALRAAGPWADVERAGMQKLKSEPAHEVYQITPEQVAEWRKAAAPLTSAWAENVRKAGGDPDVVMQELRGSLTRYQAAY